MRWKTAYKLNKTETSVVKQEIPTKIGFLGGQVQVDPFLSSRNKFYCNVLIIIFLFPNSLMKVEIIQVRFLNEFFRMESVSIFLISVGFLPDSRCRTGR